MVTSSFTGVVTTTVSPKVGGTVVGPVGSSVGRPAVDPVVSGLAVGKVVTVAVIRAGIGTGAARADDPVFNGTCQVVTKGVPRTASPSVTSSGAVVTTLVVSVVLTGTRRTSVGTVVAPAGRRAGVAST